MGLERSYSLPQSLGLGALGVGVTGAWHAHVHGTPTEYQAFPGAVQPADMSQESASSGETPPMECKAIGFASKSIILQVQPRT